MAKNNELAEVIFKHADELSVVPVAQFFVEKHTQTVADIKDAKTRKTELELAKQKFEPLETRFLTRQTALKEAGTKLTEFHAPLGGESFRALLDEQISEQPVFTERLAAHNSVQTLQHERDGLAANPDAGLVEKAKLKAQQLALTGKIKLEERSAGKLEKAIGRQLIENSLEESVRCESTTSIVDQISSQRKAIAERLSELEESQSIKDEVATQLCKELSIERIENGKTLDAEISKCDKTVRGLEATLNTAAGELLPELQNFERDRLPAELATMLGDTKPQATKEGAAEPPTPFGWSVLAVALVVVCYVGYWALGAAWGLLSDGVSAVVGGLPDGSDFTPYRTSEHTEKSIEDMGLAARSKEDVIQLIGKPSATHKEWPHYRSSGVFATDEKWAYYDFVIDEVTDTRNELYVYFDKDGSVCDYEVN